ncbi:MAG: glycosyltransferase [Sandaracinaceae bacterium]|nr:glycosyltransferase [Sandaracinaceae bacterium]
MAPRRPSRRPRGPLPRERHGHRPARGCRRAARRAESSARAASSSSPWAGSSRSRAWRSRSRRSRRPTGSSCGSPARARSSAPSSGTRRGSAPARFFGVVTGARKAALLAAADAFVLPSMRERSGRTEGMPTAALEAAAAGVPMVASAVGGVAEVFGHEQSALLVEPGDARALRAAGAAPAGGSRAATPPLARQHAPSAAARILARARAALRGAARAVSRQGWMRRARAGGR